MDCLNFEPYEPDPNEFVPVGTGAGVHLHDYIITGMNSLEGEHVPFDMTMRPSTQASAALERADCPPRAHVLVCSSEITSRHVDPCDSHTARGPLMPLSQDSLSQDPLLGPSRP